jgi:DeoR/GlpR family transcriptional regulator of sugar metabolism
MPIERRRTEVLEFVRQRRFASLPELRDAFDVSESTIRRDLEYLEEQGTARRIHGGVLYSGESPKLPHFDSQQPAQWAEKRAIAERVASLIEDGDTLLLDGGSTTYEVARLLVGRAVHVVTNSLPVANLLAADTSSDLVLIGGNICPRSGVAQGPYADKMIAAVHVRRAILSVAGVHETGYYNNNLLLVETQRAMLRAADEVIVAADSTKFDRKSLAHLGPLESAGRLVCDDRIDPAWQRRLAAVGVELVAARAIDRGYHANNDHSGKQKEHA